LDRFAVLRFLAWLVLFWTEARHLSEIGVACQGGAKGKT